MPAACRIASTVALVEVLVLGGEHVDRRARSTAARAGSSCGQTKRRRENTHVSAARDVRQQERPGLLDQRVRRGRLRRAAATRRARPRRAARRHARRSADRAGSRRRRAAAARASSSAPRGGHRLVVRALARPERAAVADGAVQPVVQPLRDREELGIAACSDAPARVDARRRACRRAASAASRRRRRRARSSSRTTRRGPRAAAPARSRSASSAAYAGVVEHLAEPLDRQRGDGHVLEPAHHVPTVRRRVRRAARP